MSNPKCIIILSEKSSGSSAFQDLLARFADVRHVAKGRHSQYETLYWLKAASILGLPQVNMLDSEVPIGRRQAEIDLRSILSENRVDSELPDNNLEMIFEGWRRLCVAHGPVFVEKSPHHLCQWSAIELILEANQRIPDVDFMIVGLVRNPMDTLYSQFQRWRTAPEKLQYQWLMAYKNLLKLRQLYRGSFAIVRYEDMVRSINCLRPVLHFCGITETQGEEDFFHDRSVAKFRRDRRFGFVLAQEVAELAKEFGYSDEELHNDSWHMWPLYRMFARLVYKPARSLRRKARTIAKGLKLTARP